MGHIAEARSKTKGKLPVTFFLATNRPNSCKARRYRRIKR